MIGVMDLRHLEYFVAVAEERNFTRAAARLHVVQSGVSAVIKSLERELGTELLERNSKRVALTNAGEVLLPRARAALDAVRDARDAVDEVRGGLRGTIRIGTLTSITLVDIPSVMGEFHRLHPGVVLRLTVSPNGSIGLVDAVRDGTLDIAFASVPGRPPAGIRVRELFRERMGLAVPLGHRLAEADDVGLADLEGELFIDFPPGYGNRIVVDQALAAAGVHRQVAIEVTDVGEAANFVREGLGLTLVPEFIVRNRSGLALKMIRDVDLEWPLGLVTSSVRPLSAAARSLLALIGEKVE
jgi:DNA-binding transcriptional LysR family regulator